MAFDRDPRFYRVGEIQDINHPEVELRNLLWQPYTAGMAFSFRLDTTKPYGTRYLFMQTNSGTSESGASEAKGDNVVLTPSGTKTFTLTGQDLQQFLQRAAALGYRFPVTGPTISPGYPCPSGTLVSDYSKLSSIGPGTDNNFYETWTMNAFQRSGISGPFFFRFGN